MHVWRYEDGAGEGPDGAETGSADAYRGFRHAEGG